MRYLNHAGTSWPKPEAVHLAVRDAEAASPDTWADRFVAAHGRIATHLGVPAETLLPTPSCTAALAVAVADVPWTPGDRVLTSSMEHHALVRPLAKVRDHVGIEVVEVPRAADGPLDLDGARRVIDYLHHRQHPFGVARLVVERHGEPIGWCGLRRLEDGELPDLGYRFFRKDWGRGYATEAAMAVLDHGFSRADIHTVRAEADARNTASWKVMERLGMQRERAWTDEEGPAVAYTLTEAAWHARRGAVLARLSRRR